jgi:hypothetical protein
MAIDESLTLSMEQEDPLRSHIFFVLTLLVFEVTLCGISCLLRNDAT